MKFGWLKSGGTAPLSGCADPATWWKAVRRDRKDSCVDPAAWRKAARRAQSGCSGPTRK